MYAITGVTGQVGGAAARALLAAGHEVRAVLRDETKAAQWRERGAEIAIASFEDADADSTGRTREARRSIITLSCELQTKSK